MKPVAAVNLGLGLFNLYLGLQSGHLVSFVAAGFCLGMGFGTWRAG